MAVMRVIPLAKSHRWPRGPRAQDMTHQHPFFLKSHAEQKRFQARLVSVSLLFIGAVSALLYLAGLLPLIFLVFALVLSIIAPFLDVPSMVRSGKLRYYSPFLLGETERNSTLVLHAGTLFDSWFLFRKNMPASERKRLAMGGMIEGMINLIEEHKRADRRDLKVRTTSYILNERSAEKLGLEKRPTDAFQTLILYYNYFNLAASYSLLNRRLVFPSIKSVQTFEGSMAALTERRPFLEKLRNSRRLAMPTGATS